MYNVYYLSLKEETPKNDYWDYGFLNDYITGNMWHTGVEYNVKEVSKLPKDGNAIVVLPARHHADMYKQVNAELKNIDHVVLFLMGDEEADYPVEKVVHNSIHTWVQNPHPHRHDSYNKLGTGYPPHKAVLSELDFNKDIDVYFSGQLTHRRRHDMNNALRKYEANSDSVVELTGTKGFTQGIEPKAYIEHMARTKIAPAPSGAVIPDSFRLYEALECMAIPLADEVNPTMTITAYWDWLFGEPAPFPHVTDWAELGELCRQYLPSYATNVNKQTAWWIKYKREFAHKVTNQVKGE